VLSPIRRAAVAFSAFHDTDGMGMNTKTNLRDSDRLRALAPVALPPASASGHGVCTAIHFAAAVECGTMESWQNAP